MSQRPRGKRHRVLETTVGCSHNIFFQGEFFDPAFGRECTRYPSSVSPVGLRSVCHLKYPNPAHSWQVCRRFDLPSDHVEKGPCHANPVSLCGCFGERFLFAPPSC